MEKSHGDVYALKTPLQYSGPGAGDPSFWKIDPNELIKDMIFRIGGITLEGDSARRFDDVAAYGVEFDRGALVRLKLLPAGGADGDGDYLEKIRLVHAPPKHRLRGRRIA